MPRKRTEAQTRKPVYAAISMDKKIHDPKRMPSEKQGNARYNLSDATEEQMVYASNKMNMRCINIYIYIYVKACEGC